jgi:hypothetical protein
MSEHKVEVQVDDVSEPWLDPSSMQLFDLVSELNRRHQFLIAQRLDRPNDEYYMQVVLDYDEPQYVVEYRDGSADAHFRAEIARVHASDDYESQTFVAKVLSDWAAEDDGWRAALPWRRLTMP